MPPELESLRCLLRRRVDVIADHAWRDRDPDGHLDALKDVSEAIAASHAELREKRLLTPRLDHFLTGASYQKALAQIEASNPQG